jgi:DNA polymerase IV
MKSILHVDGDSFFASCEIAVNPMLRGRPVVTGQERGIVSSMTYDAKSRGVVRGMPIFQVRKLFPEVVVVPSDYKLYSLFSRRMIHIVSRYSDMVHEYSIDECFADLTETIEKCQESEEEIVRRIKNELQKELGITFSLGLAPTKVLAKVASKAEKPNGLTVIKLEEINDFLKRLPIQKVWGIGKETSVLLFNHGIRSAYDFVSCLDEVVRALVSKPYYEIYLELKGISVFSCNGSHEASKSISRTRSFDQTGKFSFIYSELSHNVEEACSALRREGLTTKAFSFFLKTQSFTYRRLDFILPHRTSSPMPILEIIRDNINFLYKKEVIYRASGITLMNLKEEGGRMHDMFGFFQKNERVDELYKAVDKITDKFGTESIFLASSQKSLKQRISKIFKMNKKEVFIHDLPMPYLGEVT